jgi:hypothetical protein
MRFEANKPGAAVARLKPVRTRSPVFGNTLAFPKPNVNDASATRSIHGLPELLFSVRLLPVSRLTKQEQMVLCIVLGLLLTGWAVKMYRAAHPPRTAIQSARP